MENFDLKNFLVENKLTGNSKQLQEYDYEKTGKDETIFAFKTEAGARVKVPADKLPNFINGLIDKNGGEPVSLTFTEKVVTSPQIKVTNVTDPMGRPMNL